MHLETVGKVRPLSFLIRPSYHMQQQHVTKSWPFHSMSSPRWVSSDSNRSKRKMAFRGFESASSALPALVKLVSLTWLSSIQLSLSRFKKLINSITAILVRYLTKRFIGDYCSGKGKFKTFNRQWSQNITEHNTMQIFCTRRRWELMIFRRFWR